MLKIVQEKDDDSPRLLTPLQPGLKRPFVLLSPLQPCLTAWIEGIGRFTPRREPGDDALYNRLTMVEPAYFALADMLPRREGKISTAALEQQIVAGQLSLKLIKIKETTRRRFDDFAEMARNDGGSLATRILVAVDREFTPDGDEERVVKFIEYHPTTQDLDSGLVSRLRAHIAARKLDLSPAPPLTMREIVEYVRTHALSNPKGFATEGLDLFASMVAAVSDLPAAQAALAEAAEGE